MFDKIRRANRRWLADVQSVTNQSSTANGENENGALPPADEMVLVQCEHFRCLAFRDKHGKWRSPFSKMELNGVLHVIEHNSN